MPEGVDPAFVLAGARLDSLDRRPVATLVYRYGNHTVDVFVRPLADAGEPPRRLVRGFTVARAVGAGMEWRGVADVEPRCSPASSIASPPRLRRRPPA